MPRRFVFPNLGKKPTHAVEADPAALDWSEAEIEALSKVSKEDLDDTRDWLKRLGQDDAAALFEAEGS